MFGFIEDDRRTAEISDIGVGCWFYSSCSDRSEQTVTPPPPPISDMSLTPSELSGESSINSIGPNDELPDFLEIARDIQNRTSCRVGSEATETGLFCEVFGTGMRVVKILWELVVRDKLRPKGGRPEHLLWMLYFLKVCH